MKIKYLPKPNMCHLQWHITNRCNWNCKHCYQNGEYLNKELGTEELFHVLDQYIDLLKLWEIKGVIQVTGGEPFMRKDLFQLLEKIHQNKEIIPTTVLMTNGSFITKEVARKLKELGIQVQISLEGMERVNDKIRGKGAFEKTTKAAKILVEEGVITIISFTSNKMNYKDFPGVVELGKQIGARVVWTDRLVPYGRGKQMEKYMLEPLELKEFYENICHISKKIKEDGNKLIVHTHRSMFFLTDESEAQNPYICSAGEIALIVMPNGDVFPCRRLPIVVGNAMRQNLFEIYYSNEFLWKLRDMNEINKLCRKCEHFEKCMGGARCIAYGYCGDPFAPDPQCWVAFKELPTAENLEAYKADDKERFLPKTGKNYLTQEGAEPYIKIGRNKLLYVNKKEQLIKKDQYLRLYPNDLKNASEDIIKKKPGFTILSFQLQEKDMNIESGEKILDFLEKLRKNGVNFKVARPLPRCLLGSNYNKLIQEFNIPNSCKDCLDLFKINENNEIELCNCKKGPIIKYMNDRNQIHEYFSFFHQKSKLSDKCRRCKWFIRRQCNGLCFTERSEK